MKYILFDLIIFASFVVAARKLLDDARLARGGGGECPWGVEQQEQHQEQEQPQHQPREPSQLLRAGGVEVVPRGAAVEDEPKNAIDENRTTAAATSTSSDRRRTATTAAAAVVVDVDVDDHVPAITSPPPEDDRSEPQGGAGPREEDTAAAREDTAGEEGGGHYFELRSVVELYGESSFFAAPAIVTGYHRVRDFDSDAEESSSYDLRNAITDQKHGGVDLRYVHPYEAYDVGTEAVCNLGPPGNPKAIDLRPCTIVAQLDKKGRSDFVTYRVSFVDYEERDKGVPFPEYLPFSRVQRVRRRRGQGGEATR